MYFGKLCNILSSKHPGLNIRKMNTESMICVHSDKIIKKVIQQSLLLFASTKRMKHIVVAFDVRLEGVHKSCVTFHITKHVPLFISARDISYFSKYLEYISGFNTLTSKDILLFLTICNYKFLIIILCPMI